jgi:hypothetical protein
MYFFGIGNMFAGPANGEVEFGCLQGVTLDFSYERATLHCGAGLYPSDVRIHTSNISCKAQFAEIDAESWYKLLGGDNYSGGRVLIIKNTTAPAAFRSHLMTTTDGVTMSVVLYRCRTDSLSFGMERTNYIIPDFGFTAFADDSGNVAYIDLGDIS